MLKLLMIFLVTICSTAVWSHGGQDPLDELQKNRSQLVAKQMAFFKLDSKEEQIDSLASQLDYLGENILILQNMMAADYPHVKAAMSKYQLDYIEVLNESLTNLKLSVKQAGLVIK
jgi:uncharacterized coiled-coil protein SlyX